MSNGEFKNTFGREAAETALPKWKLFDEVEVRILKGHTGKVPIYRHEIKDLFRNTRYAIFINCEDLAQATYQQLGYKLEHFDNQTQGINYVLAKYIGLSAEEIDSLGSDHILDKKCKAQWLYDAVKTMFAKNQIPSNVLADTNANHNNKYQLSSVFVPVVINNHLVTIRCNYTTQKASIWFAKHKVSTPLYLPIGGSSQNDNITQETL